MSAVEAFPLQWPAGWKRTPGHRRERGQFDTAFAKARDGMMAEIARMGGKLPVLSSNMALRRDGLPYAQQARIDDPGIAVYFGYKGQQMCFACDRYASVEANTQAIRKTIEALRGIERWGASDMMERAFTGFAQLAAPPDVRTWWQVLGVSEHASGSEIRDAYRRLRKTAHPDHGGSAEDFHAVQTAYDQAPVEGRDEH